MVDIVDSKTRSRMMSAIRGKDTRPEMFLRRAMHTAGFRYRLHRKDLPGTPDMVFSRYRAVIFVHGCFWHRHPGCRFTSTPATRPDFWNAKFKRNVERDLANRKELTKAGWRVGIVWECTLKERRPPDIVDAISAWLKSDKKFLEF